MTTEEMFADGLVAKLELKPDKHYILLIDKYEISDAAMRKINRLIFERWKIAAIAVRTAKPKDVILGVEIETK